MGKCSLSEASKKHFLSGNMEGKEANTGKLQKGRNLKEEWSQDSLALTLVTLKSKS